MNPKRIWPLVLLLGFIFSASAVQAGNDDRLRQIIEPMIAAHDGDVAVAIKHLKTGEEFAQRADEVMPTASLIKLPLMIVIRLMMR